MDTLQSEEFFLDFKRSTDNGSGNRLHNNDRQYLARAISGFGNSEGGLIIWGVECSPDPKKGDVASTKVLIENPKRFVSWLEGTVSGCTIPPHSRVSHIAIESKSKLDFGYVATLIPKSYEAPHQCVKPPQYYIRAGSDFVPAPHGLLAGMFGRRPQPFIFHMWAIALLKIVSGKQSKSAFEINLGLNLRSWGPGLARDIYVNLISHTQKGLSRAEIALPDKENWRGYRSFGIIFNLISIPEFRLAPEMIAHPLGVNLYLEEPFEDDLHYKIVFGCSESAPKKIESRTSPKEIQNAIKDLFDNRGDPDAETKFIMKVLKIEEKEKSFEREEYYQTL